MSASGKNKPYRRRKRISGKNGNKTAIEGPDESGYCKPPKHSQFKPGQSGNPLGRPKRCKSIPRMIYEAGMRNIRVSMDGQIVEIPMIEAAIGKLWEKTIKGDIKAWQVVASHFDLKETEILADPAENDRHDATQLRLWATATLSGIPFDEIAEMDIEAVIRGYQQLVALKGRKLD